MTTQDQAALRSEIAKLLGLQKGRDIPGMRLNPTSPAAKHYYLEVEDWHYDEDDENPQHTIYVNFESQLNAVLAWYTKINQDKELK